MSYYISLTDPVTGETLQLDTPHHMRRSTTAIKGATMNATNETTTLQIPAATIELHPGERYAGPVLDADGHIKHYLVLLPHRPESRMTWDAANAWAESVGGQLPDRQEQALLFANCKLHLQSGWHWSSQEHEDYASSAWVCIFNYCLQHYLHKSFEGSAVAVRLIAAI